MHQSSRKPFFLAKILQFITFNAIFVFPSKMVFEKPALILQISDILPFYQYYYQIYKQSIIMNYQINQLNSKNQSESKSATQSPFFKPGIYKQNDLANAMTNHSASYSDLDSWDKQENENIFEDNLLIKLKEQRKKIQQLTYIYQRTEEQLKKQEETNKKLQLQLADNEQLKTTKLKFLSLNKEFEELYNQKCSLQQKNQKLEESLQQINKEHQRLLKLTQLQKLRKQQEWNQQVNKFHQILKNKEDEIRNNLNVYQVKQKQFRQQCNRLNQVIRQIKQDMCDMRRNAQAEIQRLGGQLIKKQGMIQKLKGANDNVKEQNSTLRRELKGMQVEFGEKEQEWLGTQDDLLFEVSNLKRKLNDSENRYNQCRYQCQKLQQKNTCYNQTITQLKQQIKKIQQQSSISLDQTIHSYQQKLTQYKNQNQQLKQSIQELLQNEMLKERICKQGQEKRKRTLMMREELREIQRMESSVKRVI